MSNPNMYFGVPVCLFTVSRYACHTYLMRANLFLTSLRCQSDRLLTLWFNIRNISPILHHLRADNNWKCLREKLRNSG